MKYHKILCCIFLVVGQFVIAQNSVRTTIDLHQKDPRFKIWAQSYYNFVNDEEFYFYIQNNTNQKYNIVVNVTINSTCHPSRTFKLDYNDVVTLMPGGRFTPDSDNSHIFIGASNAKDCRVKRGDKYTFLSSIDYYYESIVNVTEQEFKKEQAERLAKEQKIEAERLKREELERAKLEKEALDKRKKEEAERERVRLEKERSDKMKADQDEKARLDKTAVTEKGKGQNTNGSSTISSSGGGAVRMSAAEQANQARLVEFERQKQIQQQKKEELARQQELAQQEAERKRQAEYEERQARIAENNRKSAALTAASTETFNQWSQGNYLGGSTALVTELASQGKTNEAWGTLAVGAGLEIVSMIAENNRKKEEEEARRAEQRRIDEERRRKLQEIEDEKRAILEQQKNEFNRIAQSTISERKGIIKGRTDFLNEAVELKSTFDAFSTENDPIYIYCAFAEDDYDYYNERVVFPDVIDVKVKENAMLYFSPIIVIYPEINGEYPFLKDIVSDVKAKFIKGNPEKIKIYNWSNNLEEIQNTYNNEVIKGQSAHFNVVMPEEPLANLYDESVEENANLFGAEKDMKTEGIEEKVKYIDYWNVQKKKE